MKATELRIGNYIRHEDKNGAFTVEVIGITPKGATVKYGPGVSTITQEEITPVPLTKQTLLRCGFSEVGIYENVLHRGDYRVYLDAEAKDGLLKYETDDYHLEVEVKSVHQLQNLYFALTGSELPVAL